MFIIVTSLLLFAHCVITDSQSSLEKWLDIRSDIFSVPVKYFIHLEPKEPVYSKIKRSIEDIKTEETVITNTEIINVKSGDRNKRTISSSSPNNRNSNRGPNLNVKAGLRYHHQQRHPNGSVSGSYATLDPKGILEVMHYVSDDKGYREYPEVGEPGAQPAAQNHFVQYQQRPLNLSKSPSIDIVTKSDVGHQSINLNQNNSTKSQPNRRDVNPIGNDHFFVPNIASPYNVPNPATLGGSLPPTPILQSAVSSVGQFGPRSPLFHKYYRPSPEEVQRSYDYHRLRSSLDPASFRPPEANAVPDVIRDKPMQITGVYNEYQPPPMQVRYRDDGPNGYVYNPPLEDTRYYNTPQYAPPQIPIDIQSPVPPPQDLYPRQPPQNFLPPVNQQFQPYPENVPAQPPLYFQAFDQQAFPPQDAYPPGQQLQFQEGFPPGQQGIPQMQGIPPYNGFGGQGPVPYVTNDAIVNQPYPANIPIYEAPAPPSIPTYSLPPPNSIPIYNQQVPPGPAPGLPGPGPAPAYIQPPPNNIPIYNQQLPQGPAGNGQNFYYASGSTPQPKYASGSTPKPNYASGTTPQPIKKA